MINHCHHLIDIYNNGLSPNWWHIRFNQVRYILEYEHKYCIQLLSPSLKKETDNPPLLPHSSIPFPRYWYIVLASSDHADEGNTSWNSRLII